MRVVPENSTEATSSEGATLSEMEGNNSSSGTVHDTKEQRGMIIMYTVPRACGIGRALYRKASLLESGWDGWVYETLSFSSRCIIGFMKWDPH